MSQTLRNSTLESLTTVNEISHLCQLEGDKIEGDEYTILVARNEAEDCFATSTCSQLHNGSDCSSFKESAVHPQGGIQNQPVVPESTKPRQQEKTLVSRAEYDETIPGRFIFEDDRQSRRSIPAKLHQNMTKKEVKSESSFLKEKKSFPNRVRQEDECDMVDPMIAEIRHMANSLQSSTHSEDSSSNFVADIRSETSCLADKENDLSPYETKPGTSHSHNTLGRFSIEKDTTSRSATLTKLQDPRDEESPPNRNMGDEKGSSSERIAANDNSTRNPINDFKSSDTTRCNDLTNLTSRFDSVYLKLAQALQFYTVPSATSAKQPQHEFQSVERVGIQEEGRHIRERKPPVTVQVDQSRSQGESTQANEPTPEAELQSIATPVQESPRPVCSHYKRRCLVRFPCCGQFYPCHGCHNESDCSEDQARAINATHIRCTICYHEQAVRCLLR